MILLLMSEYMAFNAGLGMIQAYSKHHLTSDTGSKLVIQILFSPKSVELSMCRQAVLRNTLTN